MKKREKGVIPHQGSSEYNIQHSLSVNTVDTHSEKPINLSLLSPIDTPPIMVKKIMKVSKDFGGAILSFRSNASLSLYLIPSAPKPATIKAKTCRRKSFAEGTIPEINSSKILGNIVEYDNNIKRIKPYQPQELECHDNTNEITTPLVQLDYSLKQILEGLNKNYYQLVSTEDELNKGVIKVREMTDLEVQGGVIYSINLKDKFKPPLDDIRQTDWLIATEIPMVHEPDWWVSTLGKWQEIKEYRYPAFYQGKKMREAKPLLVYGREIENEEGKKEIIPITGDQDSLWITIPVHLNKQFNLPDLYFEPINTFEDSGPAKMFDALLEMSNHFKDIKKMDLVLPVVDLSDRALASMGILSPYEAYIAICINKLIANETHHIRDLIQHGCDNRNPDKPSTLNNKINHISCDFQIQTKNAKELVHLASSSYYNDNLVDLHPKWDNIVVPLAQSQTKIRAKAGWHPLPDEILKKFHLASALSSQTNTGK